MTTENLIRNSNINRLLPLTILTWDVGKIAENELNNELLYIPIKKFNTIKATSNAAYKHLSRTVNL
jgi:hypothetical protein